MDTVKSFVTHLFCALLQMTNVNICHKITHKYLEVVLGRWWFNIMDVLDTKNADEDGVVNDNGAALEEEYVYFSGMVGESTNWAKEGVKSCGLDK